MYSSSHSYRVFAAFSVFRTNPFTGFSQRYRVFAAFSVFRTNPFTGFSHRYRVFAVFSRFRTNPLQVLATVTEYSLLSLGLEPTLYRF